MKRFLILLLGLGPALTGHSEPASIAPQIKRVEGLSIRVVGGGWGSVDPDDIRQFLALVSRQFFATFGDRVAPSIQVRHRFGAPQVAYDRSPEGEFVIELTARNERWYQYAYQFSHELCHVFSRFDRKEHGAEIVRSNQWFEESVCEAASLYALRQLVQTWPTEPFAARFPAAGRVLAQYAQELISQPHRQLPEGTAFAAWFADNQAALRDEPYQRQKNELVAAVLLPLFEDEPRGWASLAFLNVGADAQHTSFEDYLEAWRNAAPAELQPFVARIEVAFGIRARAAPTAASAPGLKSPLSRSPRAAPASGN